MDKGTIVIVRIIRRMVAMAIERERERESDFDVCVCLFRRRTTIASRMY